MDVTGEEVDVEEIIKATVVRDALLTQMVIVGHMVSRSHNTTSENHAPPKNPSTNIWGNKYQHYGEILVERAPQVWVI